MKRLKNSVGFSAVEALLILVIVGILGFTGWFVYHAQKNVNEVHSAQQAVSGPARNFTVHDEQVAEAKAMKGWLQFSNATIGLKFRYPSSWGSAQLQTMGPTGGTFYKISFDKRTYTYLTIKPKAALQESDTTFASLKAGLTKYVNTRHVFANSETMVGDVVPSVGNQDAEIYAARLINLYKVDASDVVLFDAKKYDSSCTQAAYATSCYTTSELDNYRRLLEDASAL